MAWNIFIGKSQAWLEEQLAAAQEELATGKTTIAGGVGEVNYQKLLTVGPTQRIAMILAALNKIAPATYPIDDVTIPKRTAATFTGPL